MEYIGMEMGETFSRIERRGVRSFLKYIRISTLPFHCTFPIGYEDIFFNIYVSQLFLSNVLYKDIYMQSPNEKENNDLMTIIYIFSHELPPACT